MYWKGTCIYLFLCLPISYQPSEDASSAFFWDLQLLVLLTVFFTITCFLGNDIIAAEGILYSQKTTGISMEMYPLENCGR